MTTWKEKHFSLFSSLSNEQLFLGSSGTTVYETFHNNVHIFLKSSLISASHLSLTTRGCRRRHRANCSWKRDDNQGSMYCGLAVVMSGNVFPTHQFSMGNVGYWGQNMGFVCRKIWLYHIYRQANQCHLLVWRQILWAHQSHRSTFGSSFSLFYQQSFNWCLIKVSFFLPPVANTSF